MNQSTLPYIAIYVVYYSDVFSVVHGRGSGGGGWFRCSGQNIVFCICKSTVGFFLSFSHSLLHVFE